jgi:glycosyltransferase involved in cell wall biosynthesis
LDGINWLHTKKKVSFGYYLNKTLANSISKFIHAFLANRIIYQSTFVQDWWNRSGWKKAKNAVIIHNGVTIPKEEDIVNAVKQRKTNRLVVLEGTIDYTPYAIKLLNDLAKSLPEDVQIEIYGKFENNSVQGKLHNRLKYKGFLEHKNVYQVFQGAVYLSLDIHPACPNTVAEALACGAPVVAFNTGALSELVDASCGKIVDYGSNPWNLGYPDVNSLSSAIVEVFEDYNSFSKNAYAKAKSNFELTHMFQKYLDVFKI